MAVAIEVARPDRLPTWPRTGAHRPAACPGVPVHVPDRGLAGARILPQDVGLAVLVEVRGDQGADGGDAAALRDAAVDHAMVGEAAGELHAAAQHIQRAVIDKVRGDVADAAAARLFEYVVVDEGGAGCAIDICVGDHVVCAGVGERERPVERRAARGVFKAAQGCGAVEGERQRRRRSFLRNLLCRESKSPRRRCW